MKPTSRTSAEIIFYRLKKKPQLKEFLSDYNDKFLSSLSDEEFINLVEFLENYYESPGPHERRASRRRQEADFYSKPPRVRDSAPSAEALTISPEDAIIDSIDWSTRRKPD